MSWLQISPSSFIDKVLQATKFQDFTIQFKDEQISCHSMVLSLFSKFFENLFTLKLEDSTDHQDFSSLPVSALSFRASISYLYAAQVEINFDTVYDFYVLSRYFMVQELNDACVEYLSHLTGSSDSLLMLIKLANDQKDREFLKHLVRFFTSNLSLQQEGFPLCYEFLDDFVEQNCFKIQPEWLLSCLAESIRLKSINCEELGLLLQHEVFLILDCFLVFKYLIQSIIHLTEFIDSCLKFSLKFFNSNKHERSIPLEWLLKILKLMSHQNFADYDEVVAMISVYTDFSTQSLLNLNFSILSKLIAISSDHNNHNLLVFCLQCLNSSWQNRKGKLWNSQMICDCLLSINMTSLTGIEIQDLILSPFGSDNELILPISKITNTTIVPLLLPKIRRRKGQFGYSK
ncbi:hypothetical protein GEMRC1_011717 [Eukaryota sp. GEM-RC1]